MKGQRGVFLFFHNQALLSALRCCTASFNRREKRNNLGVRKLHWLMVESTSIRLFIHAARTESPAKRTCQVHQLCIRPSRKGDSRVHYDSLDSGLSQED